VTRLPPKRDIDFSIDIIPRSTPMSKNPYSMSNLDLLEMKMKLQELLEKGYINPIVYPWEEHVLFVKKKKYGTHKLCIGYMKLKFTVRTTIHCLK